MSNETQYKYLEPCPRSNYQQLWVKGRHIRAEILYRMTVNAEPRTPEEVARDYDLPVEAVHEDIDYAVCYQALLDAERAREAVKIKQRGLDQPPLIPADASIAP